MMKHDGEPKEKSTGGGDSRMRLKDESGLTKYQPQEEKKGDTIPRKG